MTALDVSCCNKLTELNCFGNKLTTLNVSGCNALTNLKCYSNQLAVIDLSGCTSLATMWAFDNLLSALNVLDCTSLSTLWCEDNKLPQLDVSNNTELKELRCNDNQLTVLDLSENKMLTSLRTYHNPIKGEAMDALIESLPTASRGGWCCVLSEDEVGVVTTSQVAAAKLKGWTSYYWNEAAKSWMEYVGSEAVQNDYRPLLAEGKVWTYRYNNGVRQYMKSLTIGGDTIIGNQTYKKIIDVASQAVEMSLREEDKKVYCCYPSRDTEILLYDFSKNAGEIISKEIKNGDTYIQKVTSVDNIMVNDKVFRCMTVHEYVIPEGMSEEEYFAGNYGYESGFWIEGIGSFAYLSSPIPYDGNYYSFYECQIDDVTYNQKDFLDAIKNDTQPTYRPFVEDSKVWKVGAITSGNPVQLVEYYYFDGDTIIDGKTCKQMMCQRYVTPDFAESNFISQDPPLCYVGAWYEEDKKVYEYDTKSKQFKMMYDFSIDANDTLQIGHYSYVIGPRTTGGIKGFKGVYREVRECREVWDCGDGVISFRCAPWLEGVGIVYGPPTLNVLNVELADPMWFLMSCTVGDEVIYLNDEYEDGATPESAGARKRFDFTHTTKPKPKAPMKRETSDACISSSEREVARPEVKAPMRREVEQSLYGEYNDLQLGINLDPLSDAYLVRITDESGKAVYEKTVNAGNIVALNIDISAYAKGHYTVIVENSQETFTGEFETLTSEIRDVRCKKEDGRSIIYNLQGQRLHSLQKGLNIVNGQKVFVK